MPTTVAFPNRTQTADLRHRGEQGRIRARRAKHCMRIACGFESCPGADALRPGACAAPSPSAARSGALSGVAPTSGDETPSTEGPWRNHQATLRPDTGFGRRAVGNQPTQ